MKIKVEAPITGVKGQSDRTPSVTTRWKESPITLESSLCSYVSSFLCISSFLFPFQPCLYFSFFKNCIIFNLSFYPLCFSSCSPFTFRWLSSHTHFLQETAFCIFPLSTTAFWNSFLFGIVLWAGVSSEFCVCSSLKLGDRWVISLPVGFCCRLNCVFVPINLIKSLIAFANHPASSCCCLLLSLISEITGPLLEHRATDNSAVSVCVWTKWREFLSVCVFEKILFFQAE